MRNNEVLNGVEPLSFDTHSTPCEMFTYVMYHHNKSPTQDGDEKDGLAKRDDSEKAKQRRWWWWNKGTGTPEHKKPSEGGEVAGQSVAASGQAAAAADQQQQPPQPPGVYLDDLKDDEEMMALYVGSVCRSSSGEHHRYSLVTGVNSSVLALSRWLGSNLSQMPIPRKVAPIFISRYVRSSKRFQ